jgi:DNA-binding IclR family transcriptional regulator
MITRSHVLKYLELVLAALVVNGVALIAVAQPAAKTAAEQSANSRSTVRSAESSPEYIEWLEQRSMLKQSAELASRVSRAAVAKAGRRPTGGDQAPPCPDC